MVLNEGLNVEPYSLLVAVHSNSFTRVWSQSARSVPLEEWLFNGDYTSAWLDALAKKFNSAEVIDPQKDGFFVELTFVIRHCRGGKHGGKKCNPGMYAWDKMTKKKRCIIRIQNKDDLCCARAIVSMKEKEDNRSQYQNLRKGKPVQERLAKRSWFLYPKHMFSNPLISCTVFSMIPLTTLVPCVCVPKTSWRW